MDTTPLRIGYCLSLSGALASNGKTARLAHQIWQEHVNTNGKLLGRPVELVCLDDQTNPKLVADIYQRLLDVEKVDVVVGGYGDNSVAPAMPLIMERKRFFLGLMALAVNAKSNYPQYFVMIPTGGAARIRADAGAGTSRQGVGSTDDAALSDYTRKATFETVVGNVTFEEGGGWAQPRADRAIPEHRKQQHLGIQEA